MARKPDAELPLKGLYALQWRMLGFLVALPVASALMPWPAPMRLLGLALPPLFLAVGAITIFALRCPACGKVLMARGLSLMPRRKCPHCRETVA